MTEMEKSMKKEISALRKAGRDREQDLDTLGSVLQGNQDLINVSLHASPGWWLVLPHTFKLSPNRPPMGCFSRTCGWLSGRRSKN